MRRVELLAASRVVVTMKLLVVVLALASAVVTAATVAWVVSHGQRELPMTRYAEPEDGVQPWDLPAGWSRSHATGLAAERRA